MTTNEVITHQPNAVTLSNESIQPLSWSDFQQEISDHLKGCFRVISFFASPDQSSPSRVNLNVVLSNKDKGLVLLRTIKPIDGTFPTFTHEYPSFHCFEREIFEQCGLKPTGHPWLKPIRFSGSNLGRTSFYPFFEMEGKEIHEVGVGPIHAGVIEPGHFRFMCYGEMVHHLEIQLGYQHRGLTALLLKKNALRIAPYIETAAGDTTIAHTWAYCQAIEKLYEFATPVEIDFIRAIALELERIAMHLAGLAGISTDIAFLPGGSSYGRLRTAIINTSMRICGSRFGRSWLRPGGVHYGFDQNLSEEVIKTLLTFQNEIRLINDLFKASRVVKHRLQRTGTVTREVAMQLGIVGVAARASGLTIDMRQNLSILPYSANPIHLVTEDPGDCWARSLVRIREIDESTDWILSVLRNHSQLSSSIGSPQKSSANSAVMSVVEGWRGEVFHYFETGSDGEILHYRVQDPSLRNWFALALAVRDNAISDFPICNKSFDLSYCGNDL